MKRKLHQFWAWMNGFFWLPCSECGQSFGGHEVGNGTKSVPIPGRESEYPAVGQVICPNCSSKED